MIVVAVAVLYLIPVVGYYLYDHFSPKQPVAQEFNELDVSGLSGNEASIKKAERYLVDNISSIEPGERLFIDYLQRRFKLDDRLSVGNSPVSLPPFEGTLADKQINYMARIAYPDKLVKEAPSQEFEGAAFTNVFSANCDQFGVPNNFWQVMQQGYEKGGYFVTHVILALEFMKNNGCEVTEVGRDLLAKSSIKMVQMMDDPMTAPDLRYEIVAFLQLSGKQELLNSAWIDEIVENQESNGSWVDATVVQSANSHTTILALWALLEYENPNTFEPLIRRPS